jgi:hypothetical protein
MDGFSLAKLQRPGASLSRRRVVLVPCDNLDLLYLNLTMQGDSGHFRHQSGAQLLGHRLHVGGDQVQLLRDLAAREIEAHQVEAQHPDSQRAVVLDEGRAAQIVKRCRVGRTTVALPVRVGIIAAVACHAIAVAVGGAIPSGQRCCQTSLKHLASWSRAERFTRGVAFKGTISGRGKPQPTAAANVALSLPRTTTPESRKNATGYRNQSKTLTG